MTGLQDQAARDALRELVREVLRDVLPSLTGSAPARAAFPSAAPTFPSAAPTFPSAAPTPSAGPAPSSPPTSVPAADPVRPVPGLAPRPAAGPRASLQAVRLSTDEELRAFVLQVLHLADNPQRRRDIVTGRLRFTLAAGAGGQAAPALTQRVDKGAVTERAIIAAATAGARLVLGPRAVLTPLARDKARALGVHVEKER